MNQTAIELFHDGFQVLHVHPQQGRTDVVPNGAQDRTFGVSGDDRSGRRFTIAHGAVIGEHPHGDVIHRLHRAQGGLEGMAQGQSDATYLNICDLQGYRLLKMKVSDAENSKY